MNKKLSLILCFAILAGCSSGVKEEKKTTSKQTEKEEETTTIANPFQDCTSLEDAKEIAGFELSCPETVLDSDSQTIQAVENSMIQVIYNQGEDELVRIRKSNSTDDITGDYNEYSQEIDQDINGKQVHLKGDDDLYSVVSWSDNEYQYCILANHALTLDEVSSLVDTIE